MSKGSVAYVAGLKTKDKILKVDSIEVQKSDDVIGIIQKRPNQAVKIELERNGEIIEMEVTPSEQPRFDLGIIDTKEEKSNLYYSLNKAVYTVKNVIDSYVMLFQGKVGIDDLSSIVGIGVVVSKTSSVLEYLNMLALISLAIGAANILPFVPLDGGKIVLVIYEWITKRKPSEKFETILSYIGWILLLLLTLVVTFKDVMSIF